MIDNLVYLVSSNVTYIAPLHRLLDSMIRRVPSESTFIVIGGSKDTGACAPVAIQPFAPCYVPDNSFDYTALIHSIEYGWLQNSTHVFLLHDTMEFTERTHELIRQADPEVDATAAVDGCVCNIGLFRTDYLLTQREKILAMRDCSKLQAVQFEGVLWRDAPRRAVYPMPVKKVTYGYHEYEAAPPAPIIIEDERQVYPDGAIRRVEFYPSIQLRKFKSSWGQSMDRIAERNKP